jgi:cytochrome c oxidase subunit 3
MKQTVLENELSRAELLALKNKRTGLSLFQFSWILVFVCLIVMNWQLRYREIVWPPPGVEPAPLLLPSIATVGLLLSVWITRRAVGFMAQGQLGAFLSHWRIAMGLGVAFVAVMVYEWVTIPVTGMYSTIFRTMTGFHGVHAVVIGAMMLMVYRRAKQKQYNTSDYWLVEATAGLWYFVVVAWILFYIVLYWI